MDGADIGSEADPSLLNLLEPSSLRVRVGPGGLLQAWVGELSYRPVEVQQAFPRSDPGRFLVLSHGEVELGLIEDVSCLDAESVRALEYGLRVHYLIPRVTRIQRIRQEPGRWTWDVITDRGPMQLTVQNLHDHLETIGSGRMLLTTEDGRGCEIVAAGSLDRHSRRQLAKVW